MPRAVWPLVNGRPAIEVVLVHAHGGKCISRVLLADTGAGNILAPFDFIVHESDCVTCGAAASTSIKLDGSHAGTHPVYLIRAEIPALGFSHQLRVVGAQSVPFRREGIASFPFLNRFTYGNFGDPKQFGLEQ